MLVQPRNSLGYPKQTSSARWQTTPQSGHRNTPSQPPLSSGQQAHVALEAFPPPPVRSQQQQQAPQLAAPPTPHLPARVLSPPPLHNRPPQRPLPMQSFAEQKPLLPQRPPSMPPPPAVLPPPPPGVPSGPVPLPSQRAPSSSTPQPPLALQPKRGLQPPTAKVVSGRQPSMSLAPRVLQSATPVPTATKVETPITTLGMKAQASALEEAKAFAQNPKAEILPLAPLASTSAQPLVTIKPTPQDLTKIVSAPPATVAPPLVVDPPVLTMTSHPTPQENKLRAHTHEAAKGPTTKNSFNKLLGRDSEDVLKQLQVVSLGSSCGVKLSIRDLGLDEATMPFDWCRSSSRFIVESLQQGFSGYLGSDFCRFELEFRKTPMTIYRCGTHSFWHDNIEDQGTRTKLLRRIDRFGQLDSDAGHTPARKLLFVRTLAGTQELREAEVLYEVVLRRFGGRGREIWLLLIIDDQPITGPILHSRYERLLFWVKPVSIGPLSLGMQGAPYSDAVAFAVKRVLRDSDALFPGGKEGSGHWPSVGSGVDILNKTGLLFDKGLRETEAGMWAGMVLHKGAAKKVLFCAFEGYREREIHYPNVDD